MVYDNVKNPQHYTNGKYQTIDIIKDKLSNEQYRGYLIGNILKYMTRFQYKNGIEDLKKAKQYLEWLIENDTKKIKGNG